MKQIAYEYSERERQRGGGREKGWEGGGGETRVDSQLAGFSSLPQGGRPGRLSKEPCQRRSERAAGMITGGDMEDCRPACKHGHSN